MLPDVPRPVLLLGAPRCSAPGRVLEEDREEWFEYVHRVPVLAGCFDGALHGTWATGYMDGAWVDEGLIRDYARGLVYVCVPVERTHASLGSEYYGPDAQACYEEAKRRGALVTSYLWDVSPHALLREAVRGIVQAEAIARGAFATARANGSTREAKA